MGRELGRASSSSAAVTVSETGGVRLTEILNTLWGENRYSFGATPTQRRFTGQVLDNVAGGLYFYNARYYDPALGRFVSADTIVPNPGNPQALNRYSYVGNNPPGFSDPSGHGPECGVQGGECSNDTYYAGFSVLDRRPWVQAYLADVMDGRHFGEILLVAVLGNALGSFVGDLLGDLMGFGVPRIQMGVGQSSIKASDLSQRMVSQTTSATTRGAAPQSGFKTYVPRRVGPVEWSRMGKNWAGGTFWGSDSPIYGTDAYQLADSLLSSGSKRVTLLSGTHGNSRGQTGLEFPPAADNSLFDADFWHYFGNPNVEVLDLMVMSQEKLSILTGEIICAWCWSDRSVLIQSLIK